MDLVSLEKILRQQADSKQSITFNNDFLSASQVSALQAGFGLPKGIFFTINAITNKEIPTPVNQQLIVNAGTVDILSQTNVPLQVIFSIDNNQELQFIISIKLPENWQFKDSFENLTVYPFDKVKSASSCAIYSTITENKFYPWADKPTESISIVPGLNMASWLTLDILGGAMDLLRGIFTGSDQYKFYGPITISESTPYPVLNMVSSPLAVNFKITDQLSVGNMCLALNVSSPEQGLQDLSLRLLASTQDLNFIIEIFSNNTYLCFFAETISGHTFGADQIMKLPCGDFQQYIPDALKKAFDAVTLKSFMITKDVDNKIGMIGLTVGSKTGYKWEIIPNTLIFDNLCLEMTQFMPGTQTNFKAISLNAQTQIFPSIFTGNFDSNIGLDNSNGTGWQISEITGSYYGSVKLGDLVKDIVGSTTPLPSVLADISFSDFGLAAAKEETGYSYSICGQAEIALPIMDTTVVSTLNLVVTYSQGAYRVMLKGCFLVGTQNFILELDLGKSNIKSTKMSVAWQAPDGQSYLRFGDIAEAFGFSESQIPNMPDGFDMNLNKVNLYYDFSTGNYNFDIQAVNDDVCKINLEDVTLQIKSLGINISKTDGKYDTTITGLLNICGVDLALSALYDTNNGWQFKGGSVGGAQINLSGIIRELFAPTGLCLPAGIPDFAITNLDFACNLKTKNYSISCTCTSKWDIPLGITNLTVSGLTASIKRENRKAIGLIKGKATLAGAQVEICYELSKGLMIDGTIPSLNLNTLVDSVCGNTVMGTLPLPSGLPAISLKDARFVIDASDKTLALSSTVPGFGNGVFIAKKVGSSWGFGFGVTVSSDWKFSSLSGALSILDSMNFGGTSLVIASFDDRNFSITGYPQFSGIINKGLNFLMSVKMDDRAELKYVKNLLKLNINSLMLHCAISPNFTSTIEGYFDGEFSIFNGFTLKNTAMRMRVGPGTLAFSLLCSLEVSLQDKLFFTGEMTVEPNGASFSATMEGDWNHPFGISGITLSNVAIELGISNEMLPAVGFAGAVSIRNVKGEMGVLLNSVNPIESVLHLKFNQLGIRTIFDICDPSILKSIPEELNPIVNSGLENVDMHIVPKTTYIGQVYYEQGFRVKGKMDLLGLNAKVDVEIDQSSGIIAEGEISAINFLNVFKITGANGEKNPNLHIDLSTKKPFCAHMSGCVEFLGLNGYSIYADLSKDGFCFNISEKLYNLVSLDLKKCTINSSGFNADGRIAFDIGTIGPVKVAGVTVIDTIPINTGFAAEAVISISNSFFLKLSGSLQVLGKKLPDFSLTLDAAISDFKALYDLVISKVLDSIAQFFTNIFATVTEWANTVKNGAIQFAGNIASVSKQVFNASMDTAVEAYKILGKGVNEITVGIKNTYQATAEATAVVLKGAGYAADQVTGSLNSVYGYSVQATAIVLKGAGYTADQVAYGLKSAYGFSADAVAIALKGAGYAADQVAGSLKTVYGYSANVTAIVLKGAGYAATEVAAGLSTAYAATANAVAIALKEAGYTIDQIGSAVTSVYHLGADAVAAALKGAGYAVDQVGSFLKNVGGYADSVVNSALSAAGYAANAIKGFMKNVFGWIPHIDLW